MQHVVELQLSELKSGYVEREASRKYTFTAKNEELIVHINTLVPYCARLQLFSIDGEKQSDMISTSLTNELFIVATDKSQDYIVEVMGLESCTYEISYTKSEERIYELVAGHPFSLDFKVGDQIFFLFFNNRNESFRITGMVDHGSVNVRARILQEGILKNLSAMVSQARESD